MAVSATETMTSRNWYQKKNGMPASSGVVRAYVHTRSGTTIAIASTTPAAIRRPGPGGADGREGVLSVMTIPPWIAVP